MFPQQGISALHRSLASREGSLALCVTCLRPCFLSAQAWRALVWGMLPLHASSLTACTYHFFYNAPSLAVRRAGRETPSAPFSHVPRKMCNSILRVEENVL